MLSQGVEGLDDGLHHYVSRDHQLELRRSGRLSAGASARLWIGLSSAHWREAWKYGERAFRYSQLDIGHALAAFRYAAGALGWTARLIEGVTTAELALLLGLDRVEDFRGVETEDAELLLEIYPTPHAHLRIPQGPTPGWGSTQGPWKGQANRLDERPIYRWPIIDDVSKATAGGERGAKAEGADYPPRLPATPARAAAVILGRRSAQRFDNKHVMSSEHFFGLLDSLLPRSEAPWDTWSFSPRLHPILFVHRVEGLEPGLYALPRDPKIVEPLRVSLRDDFEWRRPESAPAHIPLSRLLATDCRALARSLNCHQAIASDGCFAMSFLSEFDSIVSPNPWRYRQLHWEAGMLGHALYLEAEAAGLRGTGIGCFFDDELKERLGLNSASFQPLYHFTVGRPLIDDRISTLPAYPGRRAHASKES